MGAPNGYGYLPMEPATITAIALGVGAAASVAGAGYSVYQGEKQADAAKDATDAQANEAKKQRDALLEKQRQEEASNAARQARQRQQALGMNTGRSSATKTGPTGLPSFGSYGGGSFLGGGR